MTIKKAPEDLKHFESCGFYDIFRSKKPGRELNTTSQTDVSL